MRLRIHNVGDAPTFRTVVRLTGAKAHATLTVPTLKPGASVLVPSSLHSPRSSTRARLSGPVNPAGRQGAEASYANNVATAADFASRHSSSTSSATESLRRLR